MKKPFSFLIISFFILSILTSCSPDKIFTIEGSSMGTIYSIKYPGSEDEGLKNAVDSLLSEISKELSVFDSTSAVSQINRNEVTKLSREFIYIYNIAQRISKETNGAFDITIGPLVNLWGFGPNEEREITQKEIDSVKNFVGYQKLTIKDGLLLKSDARIELNFNAVAKGYAVDRVADLLQKRGHSDCIIEIGGEVVARGSRYKKPWRVGIQVPTKEQDGEIESRYIFLLQNRAVATSGNYRNYHEINGNRFSHIINPQTGLAEQSNLLSVTVIADDCTTADAYATAFMVMGMEASKIYLTKHPEYAAYFIYVTSEGLMSSYRTDNFPNSVK